MDGITDTELMEWIARGRADALGILYDRHASRLLRLAMRSLRDLTEAEDVVQDAFIEAWRRAEAFDPARGTVRTWLAVRVRSRAADRIRRRALRQRRPRPVVRTVAPAPDDGAAGVVTSERLESMMHRLPAGQRAVIELRFAGGMTFAEVAATLGIPLGSAKSRTAAALGRLRQSFNAPVAAAS